MPTLADEEAGKRELVKATKRLAVRVLGLSAPHFIDEAIIKGNPAKIEIGSGTVTLNKKVVNKNSYVLTILME
ncbi:hypothetical protein ACIQAL_03615 [Pseudomonas sp. NPDC088368]|uniref:hypothetical protein n=1 Tax=Pseudomonas sp. NPDC088368 TaxID=3364453 RepID=UPI00381550B4